MAYRPSERRSEKTYMEIWWSTFDLDIAVGHVLIMSESSTFVLQATTGMTIFGKGRVVARISRSRRRFRGEDEA